MDNYEPYSSYNKDWQSSGQLPSSSVDNLGQRIHRRLQRENFFESRGENNVKSKLEFCEKNSPNFYPPRSENVTNSSYFLTDSKAHEHSHQNYKVQRNGRNACLDSPDRPVRFNDVPKDNNFPYRRVEAKQGDEVTSRDSWRSGEYQDERKAGQQSKDFSDDYYLPNYTSYSQGNRFTKGSNCDYDEHSSNRDIDYYQESNTVNNRNKSLMDYCGSSKAYTESRRDFDPREKFSSSTTTSKWQSHKISQSARVDARPYHEQRRKTLLNPPNVDKKWSSNIQSGGISMEFSSCNVDINVKENISSDILQCFVCRIQNFTNLYTYRDHLLSSQHQHMHQLLLERNQGLVAFKRSSVKQSHRFLENRLQKSINKPIGNTNFQQCFFCKCSVLNIALHSHNNLFQHKELVEFLRPLCCSIKFMNRLDYEAHRYTTRHLQENQQRETEFVTVIVEEVLKTIPSSETKQMASTFLKKKIRDKLESEPLVAVKEMFYCVACEISMPEFRRDFHQSTSDHHEKKCLYLAANEHRLFTIALTMYDKLKDLQEVRNQLGNFETDSKICPRSETAEAEADEDFEYDFNAIVSEPSKASTVSTSSVAMQVEKSGDEQELEREISGIHGSQHKKTDINIQGLSSKATGNVEVIDRISDIAGRSEQGIPVLTDAERDNLTRSSDDVNATVQALEEKNANVGIESDDEFEYTIPNELVEAPVHHAVEQPPVGGSTELNLTEEFEYELPQNSTSVSRRLEPVQSDPNGKDIEVDNEGDEFQYELSNECQATMKSDELINSVNTNEPSSVLHKSTTCESHTSSKASSKEESKGVCSQSDAKNINDQKSENSKIVVSGDIDNVEFEYDLNNALEPSQLFTRSSNSKHIDDAENSNDNGIALDSSFTSRKAAEVEDKISVVLSEHKTDNTEQLKNEDEEFEYDIDGVTKDMPLTCTNDEAVDLNRQTEHSKSTPKSKKKFDCEKFDYEIRSEKDSELRFDSSSVAGIVAVHNEHSSISPSSAEEDSNRRPEEFDYDMTVASLDDSLKTKTPEVNTLHDTEPIEACQQANFTAKKKPITCALFDGRQKIDAEAQNDLHDAPITVFREVKKTSCGDDAMSDHTTDTEDEFNYESHSPIPLRAPKSVMNSSRKQKQSVEDNDGESEHEFEEVEGENASLLRIISVHSLSETSKSDKTIRDRKRGGNMSETSKKDPEKDIDKTFSKKRNRTVDFDISSSAKRQMISSDNDTTILPRQSCRGRRGQPGRQSLRKLSILTAGNRETDFKPKQEEDFSEVCSESSGRGKKKQVGKRGRGTALCVSGNSSGNLAGERVKRRSVLPIKYCDD